MNFKLAIKVKEKDNNQNDWDMARGVLSMESPGNYAGRKKKKGKK